MTQIMKLEVVATNVIQLGTCTYLIHLLESKSQYDTNIRRVNVVSKDSTYSYMYSKKIIQYLEKKGMCIIDSYYLSSKQTGVWRIYR